MVLLIFSLASHAHRRQSAVPVPVVALAVSHVAALGAGRTSPHLRFEAVGTDIPRDSVDREHGVDWTFMDEDENSRATASGHDEPRYRRLRSWETHHLYQVRSEQAIASQQARKLASSTIDTISSLKAADLPIRGATGHSAEPKVAVRCGPRVQGSISRPWRDIARVLLLHRNSLKSSAAQQLPGSDSSCGTTSKLEYLESLTT